MAYFSRSILAVSEQINESMISRKDYANNSVKSMESFESFDVWTETERFQRI